jgi:hypothetical protein
MQELIPIEIIENKIFIIRGQKVMLDRDLAQLYGVETKALNRAVKRNIERFPEKFMFQLTDEEWENLRCHFGTSSSDDKNLKSQIATSNWGGQRYLPYVFTEHGALMLSSVLNSKRAIILTSPLVGEVDFQYEQKPASIRKSGEGCCNQRSFFTPHPEILTLVPRVEFHPSPTRGEGKGSVSSIKFKNRI